MAGRGRRIAIILIVLAVVLSAGRWGSGFLTERLWEAGVSEPVAVAGARRALLALLLELLGLFIAVTWFVLHFSIAARVALPDRAPPERDDARLWPSHVPRWSLTVFAVVLGVVLGSGAGGWLDELRLALDRVRLGVPDPLLGADLGVFVRDLPLWIHLQERAATLVAGALGGVVLLHLGGGMIGFRARRLRVSPRARGHLAVLLSVLAVTLMWGCALEPYRLAAGIRGPLLTSEFLLRSLVAEVQAGLAAAAGVISFLWWLRMRGAAAFALWLVFGLAILVGRALPLHSEAAIADPTWQATARKLDSVAFGLARVEGTIPTGRAPAASLTPTLWDQPAIQRTAAESGSIVELRRGWVDVPGGRGRRPVWFGVREVAGQPPALLALSDDQVSPSGGVLSWREGDSTPAPGVRGFRELSPHTLRPGFLATELSPEARGLVLDGWPKRLVLAWALQVPRILSAPAGTRVGWRLDPAMRLRAIAPFAHWTPPQARLLGSALVWQSDGLLTSSLFPSSTRIAWGGMQVSMVRSAFLGLVDAHSGSVRVFRRDPTDSLAAAWARVTAPLIEAPSAIPAELRDGESYPEELLLAQALALQGPAWDAGRLETGLEGGVILPPQEPGGSAALIPFTDSAKRDIRRVFLARRFASGDSLRLVPLDSLARVEIGSRLTQGWGMFPFQQALRDSVDAEGGKLVLGRVRFVLAAEGLAAYQPAWSVPASGPAEVVLVNVALGGRAGASGKIADAWRNLRGEIAPIPVGSGLQAVLDSVRRWFRHADSALKQGDLQEFGRAMQYLRELLVPGK